MNRSMRLAATRERKYASNEVEYPTAAYVPSQFMGTPKMMMDFQCSGTLSPQV